MICGLLIVFGFASIHFLDDTNAIGASVSDTTCMKKEAEEN